LQKIINRKDNQIADLKSRLRRQEAELKAIEEFKQQYKYITKQSNENALMSLSTREELSLIKQSYDKLKAEYLALKMRTLSMHEMGKDMEKLFKNSEFSDCTIICGNQRLHLHKCILAIRSDYLRSLIIHRKSPKSELNQSFHSIFSNDGKNVKVLNMVPSNKKNQTKKKKEEPLITVRSDYNNKLLSRSINNVDPIVYNDTRRLYDVPLNIEIKDISPNLIMQIMFYIYTGDMDNLLNDENCQTILDIAKKYKLASLEIECMNYLQDALTEQNVSSVLIQAFNQDNQETVEKCFDFILKLNKFNLHASKEWQAFKQQKPHSALNLYESYMEYKEKYQREALAQSAENEANTNRSTISNNYISKMKMNFSNAENDSLDTSKYKDSHARSHFRLLEQQQQNKSKSKTTDDIIPGWNVSTRLERNYLQNV